MRFDLDLKHFWRENAQSSGKPFRTDKPRAPIALSVDDHWLLDEMKAPSTVRYFRDAAWRADLHRACNDRCEEALGIRPFGEAVEGPRPLRIERILGCRVELTEGGTPWLEPAIESVQQLGAHLDRIERMNDAEFASLICSDGWRPQPQPLVDGRKKVVGASSRGPATVATSVIGTTPLLYALVDEPAVMERFYETLAHTLIRHHRFIEKATNVEYRGYSWLDDNCALFSPPLYERFCMPLMRRVFGQFAPRPEDWRFQHSDSAMEHLLGLLAELNFHAVNFGPTIPAGHIRRHMPRTEIRGQIAPNTLRNGTPDDVVAEVRRDFAAVGADGGLLLTTSGSISAGTTLDSIRGFMWAAQEHARYDGKRER